MVPSPVGSKSPGEHPYNYTGRMDIRSRSGETVNDSLQIIFGRAGKDPHGWVACRVQDSARASLHSAGR